MQLPNLNFIAKKNQAPFVIIAIFAVLTGFILISNGDLKTKGDHIQYVKIAGITLKVDLALTKEEQGRGLSGRRELKEDEGMLFVFDHPDKYFFWMKDMHFAIDMIWIGEDSRVIYIKKDAKPESYLETYGPDKDAKYVLEVVAGFSDEHNLKEGDSVELTRTLN